MNRNTIAAGLAMVVLAGVIGAWIASAQGQPAQPPPAANGVKWEYATLTVYVQTARSVWRLSTPTQELVVESSRDDQASGMAAKLGVKGGMRGILDALGRDGWDLAYVHVAPPASNQTVTTYYFKRPVR